MSDQISGTSKHSGGSAHGPAILQIVPTLESGGAERSTIDIAAALADAGFVPLVASAGGRMVAELQAKGGEWIALPVDSKSPLALLANARRLQRIIGTRNVQLVHARSRAPAWSALIAARRARVPFVTTYHGAYSTETPLKRFYNSVMLRGDAVIANSEWTADQIRTRYAIRPRRLVTIPRGIDLDRFDPKSVSGERIHAQRVRWNVRDDETVVLFPGRFSRRKGQRVAVEAFARLAAQSSVDGLRLIFTGEGQDAREIVGLIRRHGLETQVTLAGHVDDMPAAILASDIVIAASSEPEAFGRVAAEAGAMARPVIAANHGGAPEIVVSGQTGLLVAPGDSTALAAALKQLVDLGVEGRTAMGTGARAHISRHFSLARMTAETLALYRELLAAHPSTSSG